MADIDQVLDFWFGLDHTDESRYEQRRKLWFGKNPAFDQAIRDQFQTLYYQAADGQLDDWQQSPRGSLALVLLFDQIPRNMFRGTPQAFATDPQALATAQAAIAQGDDQLLLPLQRLFIYLPFEHSENLEHQHQSVDLFRQLVRGQTDLQDLLDYAIRHFNVIQQFGRFPHRNAILGRTTTEAEALFLQQPGSSF